MHDDEIVGVCDVDCSDIDIVVRDPQGNEAGSDRETDDVPIVGVRPALSGTYSVTIIMAGCSAAPCRFGVGVYGK